MHCSHSVTIDGLFLVRDSVVDGGDVGHRFCWCFCNNGRVFLVRHWDHDLLVALHYYRFLGRCRFAVLIFLLDGLVARRLHPAVQDLRGTGRVAGVR